MKRNLVWYILIVLLVILSLMIVNLLNINDIAQEKSKIEILGKKVLILKSKQNNISIPHLNIKGTIKEINSNVINIEFSDYAKTFLGTTQITINNKNYNLQENQRVFIKFNDINIEEYNLYYSNIEIYKYIKEINLDNKRKDFFICKDDFGYFIKTEGTSFKYNNHIYFKDSIDLSENDEEYFINIENGVLLIEKYKNILFPFKIYNMINPQETRFNEIIEIYSNKQKV